jgi:segregation and condensation protein B
MRVAELELDLEAFEGPLDLLLTLVLREELELADVDVTGIVLTFLDLPRQRDELDLEACGEFLVLVASLLELKARLLFGEDAGELEELDPELAAEELALRLEQYRRVKESAARAAAAGRRRPGAGAAGAGRRAAGAARRPPAAALPADLAVRGALPLAARAPGPAGLRARAGRALARRAGGGVPGPAGARPRRRGSHRAGRPVRADSRPAQAGRTCRREKERHVDSRPLRLIAPSPLEALARALEALLVIASAPLSVDDLAAAAADDPERIEAALRLLSERYSEGRSGIVLERVAGGYAFRASREAAAACSRLVERPVQRGLSQAALETLAIIAYLGPCTRPEIARIRGVAAESAVANLLERGLIAEAGRDGGAGGAIRYRVTALFERVFGLESLSQLPRVDELGDGSEQIRSRLESVAERRGA